MKSAPFAVLAIGVLGLSSANATMTPHHPRGEKIIEHAVPGGRASEVCVIPNHFAGAKYSQKDLGHETSLCEVDAYSNAAVCPKTSSTNPGLEFYEIPTGMTADQVEAKNCELAPPAKLKKIAKYKLSTSCSYTPAIVGYYHLARILGDIANVPPAVLRTFDLENHMDLGKKALRLTPPSDLINQTWASLMSAFQAGGASKRKDLLLTDNLDQSYGAFVHNPGGDEFYKEFFQGGKVNHERAANFRERNPAFQLVKNSASVTTMIPRDFTTANVQKMVQMKDAADMIVIDTLMNQQDRFGNIDYINRYYFYDAAKPKADGSPSLRSEKNVEPAMASKAVLVKEMILRDNDCGVAKENIAAKAGLAGLIRHMDPKVYTRLIKLDMVADQEYVTKFFRSNLMFTATDWQSVRTNLKNLASSLKAKCKSGDLKLDLDVETYFSGKPLKQPACEPAST